MRQTFGCARMYYSPPHYIGCFLNQGRGGNRDLFFCSGVLCTLIVLHSLTIHCTLIHAGQVQAGERDRAAKASLISQNEWDEWGDNEWYGVKPGFSTCLRVCTSSPPHDIGCLLYQGRGGNRNQFCCSGVLWGACFVVVGLYIVCFLHVSQNNPHGGGYPNELQVQGSHC